MAPVRDGDRFAFRHLVIRDVAYETLTKEDRADLHERVGDWIELTAASGASTYDEIVGYHLEQAYRYHVALHAFDDQARRLAGRACSLLAEAGRRAYRRGDVPATIALLARALDLIEKDEPRRPALLVDLGRAAMGVFRLHEAEAAFTEAVEAAATAGDEGAELIAQVALLSYRVVIEPEAVDFDAALEQARSRSTGTREPGTISGLRAPTGSSGGFISVAASSGSPPPPWSKASRRGAVSATSSSESTYRISLSRWPEAPRRPRTRWPAASSSSSSRGATA